MKLLVHFSFGLIVFRLVALKLNYELPFSFPLFGFAISREHERRVAVVADVGDMDELSLQTPYRRYSSRPI